MYTYRTYLQLLIFVSVQKAKNTSLLLFIPLGIYLSFTSSSILIKRHTTIRRDDTLA